MAEKKRKRKGERPDGLIQRSLQIGYKPDGTPDRKYFYGHTAAEAERKRDEYKESLSRSSKFSINITVSEWVSIYKNTYRTRVNKAYLKIDDVPYNRLVKKLGRMKVIDVKETDLQTAVNELSGMSYSTINKYIQAIKRVFEKAKKNKIITDNPAEDLAMPPYEKGTHRSLEYWEVEHILKNWDNEDARTGLWVMIMLLCGLRRGEMMALRWENVNLNERTLNVCETGVIHTNKMRIESRTKTEAGIRVLPICQALYDALLTVPENMRLGIVCTSAKGKPLTESAVRRGLKHFCTVMERILNNEPTSQRGKRNDIEKKKQSVTKIRKTFSFTAHDLRHTFATSLYDAGIPVKAAQYFLGHADIRITLDLYTHLSKEREVSSRNQTVMYLDKWVDQRVKNAYKFEHKED